MYAQLWHTADLASKRATARQNAAVEAARDLIALLLKHADIFLGTGAKPIGHGIILAGCGRYPWRTVGCGIAVVRRAGRKAAMISTFAR
jgi:hypothetical protein